MEFRILGPIEASGAGRSLRLSSRRQRAVLAVLVLGRGDDVRSDELIDALWGEAPPRSAAKALQNHVLRLRKALGADVIETRPSGYRLAVDAADVDVMRFEALVRDAAAASADGRVDDVVALLRAAVGLWRGPPLEELAEWPPGRVQVERLTELYRVATEDLVDAEIERGHAAPAAAELEAMVAAEPYRERRWAMLMLALYRSGRQAEALRAYQRARTLLGEELGIEPGPELRSLESAIARQDPSLAPVPGRDPAPAAPAVDDLSAEPPFKGLAPFEVADASLFFGRTRLVEDLVARAATSGFVAVVGASGSGKSSVVRAGVVASLAAGAIDGSAEWPAVVMTPGTHPITELAGVLAPMSAVRVSDIVDRCRADPGALNALVRTGLAPTARFVLVIDQFEELFALASDANEVAQFVDLIVSAAGDPSLRVLVVIALRADFYGHCVAYPTLATAVEDGTALLCPMTPEEIIEAVEGPAAAASLRVEAGLAALAARDVGGEPGALPLLSHALLETWRRRASGTLTVAGYQDSGGVRGAVAETAESVYGLLGPDQQMRVRRLFLRLTELGEGTEDTRRRVQYEALGPACGAAETRELLQLLARARLVTLHEDSVQIAHEALIREWPRLRHWLDEDRDGGRVQRHLARAAADWSERGRDPAELYRGQRLADVQLWVRRGDGDIVLNDAEAEFLAASSVREEIEMAERAAVAQARERSHRRLRVLLVVTATLLVVALVGGVVALVQRDAAQRAGAQERAVSRAAEVSRLAAQSRALLGSDRNAAALLALEANRRRDDAQTQDAVFSAVVDEPRRVRTLPTGTSEGVWALPRSGSALVLSHGRLGVWSTETRNLLARLDVTGVQAAAVRADGLIAAVRSDGTVAFRTGAGRRVGADLRSDRRGPVASAAFSPDGHTLAVAFGNWSDSRAVATDSTARLFDVDARRPGPTIRGSSAAVTALAFSPDGTRLALGAADARVVVVDPATGSPVGAALTATASVIGLAFDPVRDRLAIGTVGAGVDVETLTDGTVVKHLAEAPSVDQPVYDPSGGILAAAGDGPLRLYDADSLDPRRDGAEGTPWMAAPGGDGLDVQLAQARVAFVPGGNLLVGGTSGPAAIWDLQGISVLDRRVPGAKSYVFPMAGGRFVAVPDTEDSVALYDRRSLTATGPPLTPGPGAQRSFLFPVAFAASYYHGDRIAVINRSGVLQLFDTASRRPIGAPVDVRVEAPVYAVFSRDMRHIAVGGQAGELRIVDLADHRVRAMVSPMTNLVLGLEFGPHDTLAAADQQHVVFYSHVFAPTPRVRDLSDLTEHQGFGMDLSPDGRMLAVGVGGDVAFYDTRTFRPTGRSVAVLDNQVSWVAFDRTGRRLVTSDNANVARLVDVRTRRTIGPELGSDVAGSGSVFSQDGRTLGTQTFAGGVLLSLDPRVWRRQACALAGRNLTVAEWRTYRPEAGPRRRTCPQYP